MKIITNMLAPKEYESKNESGNILNIDMYNAKEKDFFSPMESLLGALASCAAVDLVEMIKKRRKELLALQIETHGERREEHPRSFHKIHMVFTATSSDLKTEEFEKLVELAAGKYCSVSGTLGVVASHEVVIKKPNGD
ncbi:osmotically inducible protein OsmC [Marivirga lumbricoides]|uniref:Osmotically inducible protein OsmC n=1 Tax=Marivirga lumbricoides TaxID=1046115 RepID=A0A2T4DV52_9BACT|nr:osmotically inducible protein OsmC [Marivirga lumbricoides]